MTLAKYFYKRFFKHFFSIAIGLTLLFSFVEFFEKMVRVSNSTIITVLKFTALNFLPTFFDSFVLSTWLATCMLIKELHQQQEWETLSILNINNKKLFTLFFWAGTILSLISFTGKELFIHNITNKAETFRMEEFKQRSNKKLFNKWFMLSENLFCHFDYLNRQTNTGNKLTLLYMSKDTAPKKIIMCDTFHINEQTKKIMLTTGHIFNVATNEYKNIFNKQIELPNFYKQLELESQNLNIIHVSYHLWNSSATLPHSVKQSLFHILLKKLFNHLQLIFYTLLTFVLFFIIARTSTYKWILILLPYPLITIINTATNVIAESTQNPLLMIPPYILLLLDILLMRNKIAK
mgnify:FL=1